MGCLGNVLWFLFGGAVSGLGWLLAGCLWCVTTVSYTHLPSSGAFWKSGAGYWFWFGDGTGAQRFGKTED